MKRSSPSPNLRRADHELAGRIDVPRAHARFKNRSQAIVEMRRIAGVTESWRYDFAPLGIDEANFVVSAKRISIFRRLSKRPAERNQQQRDCSSLQVHLCINNLGER